MKIGPVEDWNGHNGPSAPQIGLTPLERFYSMVGFRVPFVGRTTVDMGAIPSAIALRNAYERLTTPVTRRGRFAR